MRRCESTFNRLRTLSRFVISPGFTRWCELKRRPGWLGLLTRLRLDNYGGRMGCMRCAQVEYSKINAPLIQTTSTNNTENAETKITSTAPTGI
ncbi:hypothetical protein CCR75_007764 [Bremia lactucae]|uniref:Uncharacterized protein n=1 Tax=Bremia lactucae TaxID=4779 RepID=A0A976IIR4_BRELC|nr:hypothetical protein CCR75_007762 [Bremia lactucae]TDH72574.1 hypothetical protein CCR75_007764 [Bremia lactucae]